MAITELLTPPPYHASTTSHVWLALLSTIAIVLWFYRAWARLAHVGGPWTAAVSDFTRMRWTMSGRVHWTMMRLHEQYGTFVRIGPNTVSIGDPREMPKIYGINANFTKSDFYRVMQPMSKGRSIQGLFNTQDLSLHRAMKRPIAGIYSMTNLVEFEPYVNTTISFFLQRLEEIQHQSQRACDLGEILQWFAFDVIGEITFSKRLGFLDKGKDVDGIIESIQRFFKYAGAVGQMPWLDLLLVKNPYISRLMPGKTSPVVLFALARARERSGLDATATTTTTSYNVNDFISRFLALRIKDPSIPEWFVTAWTTSNVMAGSDTTAIYLRAIIYFLITQPLSLARLTTELAQARRQSQLSEIVTWRECRKLPYLDACIKEAGRLHPPIGLSMERVVPAGGAEIGGKFFPAGTVVGMNPWVVHRCREVFGEDADKWRPERWLEVDGTTRASMERCLLTFGAGARTCLGKNIALLEIYKLIPTMFARYEVSQANAGWTVSNHWLAIQSDMRVHVRRHSDQVDDEQERTS